MRGEQLVKASRTFLLVYGVNHCQPLLHKSLNLCQVDVCRRCRDLQVRFLQNLSHRCNVAGVFIRRVTARRTASFPSWFNHIYPLHHW